MKTLVQTLQSYKIADALLVVAGSIFLGLLGQVAIPLPFTPIPIVVQMQAIFLFALCLGAKRASLLVGLFLLQGAMGLPVFANGGAGLPILLGPRGGYLVGYLLAAWTIGTLRDHDKELSPLRAFGYLMVGNALIYAVGAFHLASFVGGASRALWLGVAPFVLGDIGKNLLAVKLWSRWKG